MNLIKGIFGKKVKWINKIGIKYIFSII